MVKEDNAHRKILENEVRFLRGVGPEKAKLLNKLGIEKIEDLITYFPREYEDRSMAKKVSELKDGE